jgi:hypothetical protein
MFYRILVLTGLVTAVLTTASPTSAPMEPSKAAASNLYRKLPLPSDTPVVIAQREAALKSVTDSNIPQSFEGGVLFDGQVVKRLTSDRFGQQMWLVRPMHVYLRLGSYIEAGRDIGEGRLVKIVSTRGESKVDLLKGRTYRIRACYGDEGPIAQSGRFFTWKGCVIALGSGSTEPSAK